MATAFASSTRQSAKSRRSCTFSCAHDTTCSQTPQIETPVLAAIRGVQIWYVGRELRACTCALLWGTHSKNYKYLTQSKASSLEAMHCVRSIPAPQLLRCLCLHRI